MPYIIPNIPATVCIDQNLGLAYVTIDGKAVNGNPVTISGGAFSATLTLPTTGGVIPPDCTSGTLNVTGTVIAANQVQLVISGTGLGCTGIGGPYGSASFEGTVIVPLSGSGTCA